jgi:antitoxin PrlF
MESAITDKGQATIPKAIRDHLGLRPGDRIKFFRHPDGTVVLLPKRPTTALRGVIKPRQPAVTLQAMEKAAPAGTVTDNPLPNGG